MAVSPQFTLQRVCLECGGLADCVQALSDSYQGLPGGTEYQFACECGHHFTIESPGRVIFALLVAPLLGWLGVGRLMMAFDGPDNWTRAVWAEMSAQAAPL